jgi:DNA-binding CsgD family transcriptional regulator
MTVPDALHQGRESFRQQAWGDAYAQLSIAANDMSLELGDLECLSMAAYLTGREQESVDVLARAYHECARVGDPARAARCAFWLGFMLVSRGEMAQGGGWLARARGHLAPGGPEVAEHGYLLIPEGLQSLEAGDAAAAVAAFSRVFELGERFRDPDLLVLGRLGRGTASIRLGRLPEGRSLLDEAMVAVTAGEVSPIVAGIVYCAVIEACHEVFDLRRAQEWTAALSRWCDAQPDLVPFRGQCQVRRAEIIQLHGEWPYAADELHQACERLAGDPAAGTAWYAQAELCRLRGEDVLAEAAYRQASESGHTPHPGLALLRMAQGQLESAAAAARLALDEAQGPLSRARLLGAYVEIMLAVSDLDAARSAGDELATVAADLDAPVLNAMAAHALGAIGLAKEDARAALAQLRRAQAAWQEVDAPYEVARVRVLVGRACRALGDDDTAALEIEAARRVFRRLGAAPALADLDKASGSAPAQGLDGLTAREVEVLRLVASGKTNRAIAAELVISEKTVARHVSNIFAKLDLSSRAAATAYAYEHDVV